METCPSLVYRRQRANMLQVFRMMTEIDNIQKINQSIQIEQASTRGHKLKSLSLDVKPILRKIHLHSGLLTNGMHCQTT